MGFWKKSFEVVQDVTSLGGTYWLRKQISRLETLRGTYERIHGEISKGNARLISVIRILEQQVQISDKRLRIAERILNPLRRDVILDTPSKNSLRRPSPSQQSPTLISQHVTKTTLDAIAPSLIGGGVGAATSVGAWGAVQVLAHASTGTAMAGLHGAAAANAGWAWFGGGSLAAHGGGMALGHVLLPGIGTAVAVGVSATLSYRDANRIGKDCETIEQANVQNSGALSKLNCDLTAVDKLRIKLEDEDDLLAIAITQTRKRLFRCGYLSHLWRLIRFWIRGYYYTPEEFPSIEYLDAAVLRFISSFNRV
jgi:hypothetical protein